MQTKSQENYQESGEDYYKKIVSNFGKEILLEKNGELDRKKLASIIFYNKSKKEILDKITIECVIPKIKEIADRILKTKSVIIDAPLLFETHLNEFCDITIGIIAKEDTCIKRICIRDEIEEETALSRINNQKDINYFKEKCDYCINNENGNNIEKQINEIFERKKLIKQEHITHL